MPSLLHHDAGILNGIRMENRIHIDIHEIIKILIVS